MRASCPRGILLGRNLAIGTGGLEFNLIRESVGTRG